MVAEVPKMLVVPAYETPALAASLRTFAPKAWTKSLDWFRAIPADVHWTVASNVDSACGELERALNEKVPFDGALVDTLAPFSAESEYAIAKLRCVDPDLPVSVTIESAASSAAHCPDFTRDNCPFDWSWNDTRALIKLLDRMVRSQPRSCSANVGGAATLLNLPSCDADWPEARTAIAQTLRPRPAAPSANSGTGFDRRMSIRYDVLQRTTLRIAESSCDVDHRWNDEAALPVYLRDISVSGAGIVSPTELDLQAIELLTPRPCRPAEWRAARIRRSRSLDAKFWEYGLEFHAHASDAK